MLPQTQHGGPSRYTFLGPEVENLLTSSTKSLRDRLCNQICFGLENSSVQILYECASSWPLGKGGCLSVGAVPMERQ